MTHDERAREVYECLECDANHNERDIAIITSALAQCERETLEKTAKAWDEMKYGELAIEYPMDAYPKWGNIFAAWCRKQAQEGT